MKANKGQQQQHIWLDNSLKKVWLDQLILEYETICYCYRVELTLPVFELNESRRCFGSWNNNHRILTISSRLLYAYPWTTTIAVLKHEMAHQICAELFHRPDESHHELFKKACTMIGLFGSMSRASSDLADSFTDVCDKPGEVTAEGRRVLVRVEKLLALSGSENEHEASLAMQRAGELLEKHNLTMEAARAEKDNFSRLIINTGKQRKPAHLLYIVSLLKEYFFVNIIYSSIYDPIKNYELRTVELFGRAENVVIAEYCYHFLINTLDSLWTANRKKFKGGGQRARNSYFIGVIEGFRRKMAETMSKKEDKRQPVSAHNRETVSSLVVQEDTALAEFISAYYPRLRTSCGTRIQLHNNIYQQAVETGRKLIFHRAVQDSSSGFGGLIE